MKTILTNSSKKSIKSSTYGLKWMACLSIPLKKFIPTIGFFLYLAFPVLGQTVYNTLQSDDVEIDDDGIIQSNTSSGHSRIYGSYLKIPVELDGKKVKGIASKNPGVFENLGIKGLTFEDNSEVNSIGTGAFMNNSIVTLTLPEGLTKIGPLAFNSNKIVELTLPTSVTNIGAYSFAPNLLESVIFDGNESNKSMIQVIGEGAFSLNPSSLGSITLPPNGNLGFVNYVDTVGGDYDVGSSITDFTLSYEAKFAYELTGLDINVDTDGIITECYCDNFDIKGITIPASITVGGNQIDIIGIKDGVFKGKEFKFVLIPEGLTSIGRDAFANNMLTHLTLPRSIRYIGESAFLNNKLTSITFEGDGTSGSNIISIGGRAFYDNQDLKPIVLPIHSLGSDTGFRYKDSRGNDYEQGADFRDFYRELYVDIPYTLIATDIELDSDGVITECYCNNFESRTFTIPTSISTVNGEEIITGIGANVFKDIFLTTLSFSTESKVTSIGGSAFQYNNLFSITLPQGLGSIGANAFGSNLNLIEITLPKVTKTGYRVYWKGSDEMDGGTNQSIKKREFSKSFELVSIHQVTLTTMIDGGEGGTVSADITPNTENSYDINTEVKLTANPDASWRFEKWVIEGQAEPVTVSELKLTLTQDTKVTAHFQYQVTLTTSVEGGQGGTVSADITPNTENSYDINTEVKLTANPDAGWRFKEWVIEGQAEPVAVLELKLTLTQDTTVTAHFEQYEVTLTTSVEGGQGGTVSVDINPNAEGRYDINTEVKLTANPDAGWRFKEWVIEGQAEPVAVLELKLTLTQDTKVTAHFIQYQVTLTTSVEEGQGGTVSADITPNAENRYAINTEVKLTANPDTGWRFKEWVIEGQAEPVAVSELKLTLTQDTKVTAHFQYQVTLTTSVEGGQGGTVSADITPNAENSYDINTEVKLTANPDAGWRFEKWVIEGQAEPVTVLELKLTLTQDTTVTAHFEQYEVTLTTSVEGGQGGTVSVDINPNAEGRYAINTEVKLTANPDASWRFKEWVIEGQAEPVAVLELKLTLTQDTKVTAHFIQYQVTLTTSVEEGQGGTVSADITPNAENRYAINTEVKLTANPDTGWRFKEWVIEGQAEPVAVSELKLTLTQDTKVTAHFIQYQVTLTTSVEGGQGGTVSADITPNTENRYAIDTEVKLTANPDAGWRFKEWVIEGQAEPVAVLELKLTLTQDTTVTAHFEQYEVTLTTSVEEGQGGTVSADITPNAENRYAIDTEVKLTANPDAGWRFKEWVIEGQAEPVAVSELKLTLTQDTTVTAHFEQYEVTLTTSVEGGQGGTVSVDINPNAEGRYAIDTEVKLTANPDAGWRFKEWVIEGQADPMTELKLKLTLTQDTEVTAHFVKQVTLTLTIDGSGAVKGLTEGGHSYKKGDVVVLEAEPTQGWRFDKWEIKGQSGYNPNSSMNVTLIRDTEITAFFIQQVTLTASVAGEQGGTINVNLKPNSETFYDINTKIELTAEADNGWRFLRWEVDGDDESNTSQKLSLTLESDAKVTAFFTKEEDGKVTSVLDEERVAFSGFPSPVESLMTIAVSAGDQIVIYNQFGISVYQAVATTTFHAVDMREMPSGVYLLRLTTPEGKLDAIRIVKK